MDGTDNQDVDQLRLLSIFHFVAAGMIGLFSLFPVVHLLLGIAIVTGRLDDPANANPPPEVFGWVFIAAGAVLIVSGLALAAVVAAAGRQLSRHTGYMYCLVVAAVECLFVPLGTVLGVFTIIVLMRPSVKELFSAR